MDKIIHYQHGDGETLALCGVPLAAKRASQNARAVTCIRCLSGLRMPRTTEGREYRRALRHVRAWIEKHSLAFGRHGKTPISLMLHVLDAFIADPETLMRLGEDCEVRVIGNRWTINEARIRSYDAGCEEAGKKAWEVSHD